MGLFDNVNLNSAGGVPLGDGVNPAPAPSGNNHPADPPGDINGTDHRALGALEDSGQGDPGQIRVQTVSLPHGTVAPTNGLTHLGTLNVGDRYVSSGQNSSGTVAARPTSSHPRDSLTVHAESPQGDNTNHGNEVRTPSDEAAHPVEESGGSFWSGGGDIVETEEERQRRLAREQAARVHYASLANPSAYSVHASRPPQVVETGSSPQASGARSRFVLDARDVHHMGGSPSRVEISNAHTGEVLRSVNLPPGNSRTVVDLPPGDYNFTAISGERSAASSNPDRLDNFQVDVSQAPSSGSGNAGAPAAPASS